MNLHKILDQVASIRVKSITDPLFKYSLILITIALIAAAIKVDTWIVVVLFCFGGLLLILGIYFFCFFSIKNPDYLRSENYQLRKKSIELLGDKDNSGNYNVTELKYISSPYAIDSGINKHIIDNEE